MWEGSYGKSMLQVYSRLSPHSPSNRPWISIATHCKQFWAGYTIALAWDMAVPYILHVSPFSGVLSASSKLLSGTVQVSQWVQRSLPGADQNFSSAQPGTSVLALMGFRLEGIVPATLLPLLLTMVSEVCVLSCNAVSQTWLSSIKVALLCSGQCCWKHL